jgi:hypothetical protein
MPPVLFVGERRSPRVLARVTNHSCASLTIDKVQLPKWLKLAETKKSELAPGQTQNLVLQVLDPLKEMTAGSVVAITAAGSGQERLLVIDRKPRLECEPQRVQAWFASDGTRSRNRIKVRPVKGLLRVHRVSVEGSGLIAKAEIEPGGQLVGEGRELDVEIYPTENSGRGGATSLKTHLEFAYKSPHGMDQARAEVEVEMRQPPQLRWAGEFTAPKEVWQSSGQKLRFQLHNQSVGGRDMRAGAKLGHSAPRERRSAAE